MSNQCLYMHRNPNTGEVFYIGIGTRKRPRKFAERNDKWKAYVAVNGKPIVEVIADNLTIEEAARQERILIAVHGLDRLTNKSPGGDGIFGFVLDDNTRKKISASKIGVRKSSETRQRMSVASKGKLKSEFHKAKLSEAKQGKPGNRFDPVLRTFINIDDGRTFHGTQRDFIKLYSLHQSAISSVIRGKTVHHKGWRVL